MNYNEPPDWFFSVRHNLGAVQLDAGLFEEAIHTYQEDLRRLPKNGWALQGLINAYSGINDLSKLKESEENFNQAWKAADIILNSSVIR